MNKEFYKDVKKAVDNTSLNQELSPGSVGRRWAPEGGVNKLNERIHRESKHMDNYGNLPFTFSKPKKYTSNKHVQCTHCGYITSASRNTVGIICNACKKYSSVTEVGI